MPEMKLRKLVPHDKREEQSRLCVIIITTCLTIHNINTSNKKLPKLGRVQLTWLCGCEFYFIFISAFFLPTCKHSYFRMQEMIVSNYLEIEDANETFRDDAYYTA